MIRRPTGAPAGAEWGEGAPPRERRRWGPRGQSLADLSMETHHVRSSARTNTDAVLDLGRADRVAPPGARNAHRATRSAAAALPNGAARVRSYRSGRVPDGGRRRLRARPS